MVVLVCLAALGVIKTVRIFITRESVRPAYQVFPKLLARV